MKSLIIKALSSAAVVPMLAIGAMSAHAGGEISIPSCGCQPSVDFATTLKSFSYQNPQYDLHQNQNANSLTKYNSLDFSNVKYDATGLNTVDYLNKNNQSASETLKISDPQKSSVFFSSIPVFSW